MTDRIAVVTGAASGIGTATALALAERGYALALTDLNGPALDEVAEGLRRRGADAMTVVGDATDESLVADVVDRVVRRHGVVDALVNNVGAVATGPVHEQTPAQWNRTIAINLTSHFLMSRAVVPHMLASREPAIVNLSSSSGKRAAPDTGAYAASKFGVIGLTQSLALDLAPLGIRVNAVCPARVDTPLAQGHAEAIARERGSTVDEVRAGWDAEIPLGRLARPEELARVIAWLLGPESSYVTGESVNVSGGLINW